MSASYCGAPAGCQPAGDRSAQLLSRLAAFAPETVAVAQVGYDDGMAPMLTAGAVTACTRRMPPVDVATALGNLLPA